MTLAARGHRLRSAVSDRRRLWIAITLGFPALYYLLMMVALLIRFEAWPNYTATHDWLGSVMEIFRATPSLSDVAPIIAEEWLFEIGRMNYDYGKGISEWSLNIIPAKLLVVLLLAAGIATVTTLVLQSRTQCSATHLRSAGAATAAGGLGALLVSMTSVTLSWVVCCATPSWVVGLAILGLGVSTSLWLEQFGSWIEYIGFAFLLFSIFWLTGEDEETSIDSDNTLLSPQPGVSQ